MSCDSDTSHFFVEDTVFKNEKLWSSERTFFFSDEKRFVFIVEMIWIVLRFLVKKSLSCRSSVDLFLSIDADQHRAPAFIQTTTAGQAFFRPASINWSEPDLLHHPSSWAGLTSGQQIWFHQVHVNRENSEWTKTFLVSEFSKCLEIRDGFPNFRRSRQFLSSQFNT